MENPGNKGSISVSHSPLDLGSGSAVQVPALEIAGLEAVTPAVVTKTKAAGTTERITGVKTFFAKLHTGAIEFLDKQIEKWLEENPEIVIKRTNVVIGEVQAKKTEPNIIVTVWY